MKFVRFLSYGLIIILSFSKVNAKPLPLFSENYCLLEKNFTVISQSSKTIHLLVYSEEAIVQSEYNGVQEINNVFKRIDGIINCSYSWNNHQYKLELDLSNAKTILNEKFNFDLAYINSKF